jgi:hypothetical protein
MTIPQLPFTGQQLRTSMVAMDDEIGTKLDSDHVSVTNSREWTAATVEQAEAEAGTATTRRAWTAQRVFQSVAAWWAASAAKTKLDGIEAGAQVNPGVVTTSTAGLQPATGFSALTYSATTDLDMAALDVQTRTITLTGNITFTTSNRANGRTVTLRLLPGASQRTLTFPVEWPFVGPKPASLAANKTAILSLTFFGSGDADCVAAYAVQP